jgi:hypothetical protein
MTTHHLCIHDDYCTFDGAVLPLGKHEIEGEITKAINEILDMIVHKIGKGEVVVCGGGDSRRMLGRKLEDRLGREVKYE